MAYYRICSTAVHHPTRQGAEPKERAGDEDNNNTQGGKVK